MPKALARLLRASLAALTVVICAVAFASSPAWAEGYLGALEDVPLMPGFAEVPNAGLEFEAATGRIVEAMATGIRKPGIDRESVLEFYRESLPPLGWRPVNGTRFVRESEVLELTVSETAKRVTVRFGLKPR